MRSGTACPGSLALLVALLSSAALAQQPHRYGCEANRIFDNQPFGSTYPANADPGCGLVNDHLGAALAIGDFNGDGFSDILIGGASKPDGAQNLTRSWLLVTQGSAGNWPRRHWVTGNGTSDSFGISVCALGKWNADMRDDYAVGAPTFPNSLIARGKV